jgi:hypothetical protein
METDQKSQHSKASSAVLLTYSHTVRGVKSFPGLEAYSLVIATVVSVVSKKYMKQNIHINERYIYLSDVHCTFLTYWFSSAIP